MGNIRCLNCNKEITTISGMECPHCRAQLSHVKIAFLSYLGPEDSLAGYQRSYKLVLLKSIFELVRAGQPISVARVSEAFRQYYLDRKKAGLPADKDADLRIAQVEKSDLRDIWLLINMNPFAAISKHGFLKAKGDGLNGVFVLQKGIDALPANEIDSILNIIERKLSRYFKGIGSKALPSCAPAVYEQEEEKAPPVAVESCPPYSPETVAAEVVPGTEEAPAVENPAVDETPGEEEAPVEEEPSCEENTPEIVLVPEVAQPGDLQAEETKPTEDHTFNSAPDDTLLEDLPLSTRAYNAFKRSGMSNLGELKAAYRDGSIAEIRNIGRTVIEEVGRLLSTRIQVGAQSAEAIGSQEAATEQSVIAGDLEEESKALKIADVFHENAFNLFRQYCKRNNIETVGQLIGFNFDNLLDERGFGIGKIAKIAERWAEIESGIKINSTDEPDEEVYEDRHLLIDESNFDLPISILQLMGGSKKVQNRLRLLEINNLGELQGATLTALERNIRAEQMEDLKTSVDYFARPYHDVLEDMFDAVAQGESFELFIKRANGSTLQAVASEYNVTREWVRQICAKNERKIMPFIGPLLSELMGQNDARYIREEQIREYIATQDYASAVIYIFREGELFTSFGSQNIFFEVNSFPDVEKTLAEIATDIVGDGINIFESVDAIESSLDEAGFGFLNADDFLDLLIFLDYQFFGDFVLKDRKSYGRLCARIVEEDFPDGISNSKEDMARLRELTKARYGDLDLPDNDRSVYARVCDYLILRGRSKYIAPARVYVDEDTLAEIKQHIDNSKQKDIFYSELFAEFEGLLALMTNIDNHQFLHGVLRYYYPADYTYSRDFLSKESGESGQSLADRICTYIAGVGVAVSKKDILRQFPGVNEVVLFNTVNNCDRLLQWEYNYYNSVTNLHLSNEDVAMIDRVLGSLIDANDGYCSEGMFFEVAQTELEGIVEKSSIKNSMNMFYAAQAVLADKYAFRNPHIARIGRFQSMVGTDIALDLIGDKTVLSLKEFLRMTDRLKWARVSAGCIFAEIEKGYIRTAADTYVRKDRFAICAEDEEYLTELLESQAEGNWWLPLQVFADSEEMLPSGLPINEFLVGSLVAENDFGWHIVAPQIKDRRYQRGILVRNSKDVVSYDRLVWMVLKDNGVTEMPESDLLTFLMIRSLALRYIPKDLQTSSLFKYSESVYIVL